MSKVTFSPDLYALPPATPAAGTLSQTRAGLQTASVRPGTSVKSAGFGTGRKFDPLGAANKAQTPDEKPSLQQQAIDLEENIKNLLLDATYAQTPRNALEKMKEAQKREKQLLRMKKDLKHDEQLSLDLTHNILFQLANTYEMNEMYTEALNTYSEIVKNKNVANGGRLRVNMGNILLQQGKFDAAIKMYRMALDQIPASNKEIRLRIMKNIGVAFIQTGQYQDAVTSLESVIEGLPDQTAAYNLALCYFALGNQENVRHGFQNLINIESYKIEANEDLQPKIFSPEETMAEEVISQHGLRELAQERKRKYARQILMTAKLFASAVSSNTTSAYEWILEAVEDSAIAEMTSELEIAKAIQHLKAKEFLKAIETLKAFEKKESKFRSAASTILSFLYLLDGDIQQARSSAALAIETDKYNSRAYNNRGNTYLAEGNLEEAKTCFQEAIGVDSLCTEGLYNLGLVYKQRHQLQEALQCFKKVHAILRNSAEVVFQIADITALQEDYESSLEWYNILLSITPTDPVVLARMGELFARNNDKVQAIHYYSESYRYYPNNTAVVDWLSSYFMGAQSYEQCINILQRGLLMQPHQKDWKSRCASALRKVGRFQDALEIYKSLHEDHPMDLDHLACLVRVSKDLGLTAEIHKYESQLKEVERLEATRSAVS